MRSSKGDEDKKMIFNSLNKLLHHLSLLIFQKRDVDLKQSDYLDYQALNIINRWAKLYSYNRLNELYSIIKPAASHESYFFNEIREKYNNLKI